MQALPRGAPVRPRRRRRASVVSPSSTHLPHRRRRRARARRRSAPPPRPPPHTHTLPARPLTPRRPVRTPQTLPLASFAPPQLRKANPACEACCAARAERGGPDHDATAIAKSAKERRRELKELRERKKREEKAEKTTSPKDDPAPGRETGAEATHRKTAPDSAATRARTRDDDANDGPSRSAAAVDGFVPTERFDPSDDRSVAKPNLSREGEGVRRDEKENDDAEKEEDEDAAPPASEDDSESLSRRKVYVGGIPFYKTPDEIRAAFDEENLPVETLECFTFADSGRFRGIAIITFATRDAARGALAWNGEEWDGKFLVARKYRPKDAAAGENAAERAAAAASAPSSPLPAVAKTEGQRVAFVGNLAWDVTEAELRAALAGCEVREVRMGADKESGAFRGYAHVEFAADEDLERAVRSNGAELKGREMKIAYATKRRDEKKRAWVERGEAEKRPGRGAGRGCGGEGRGTRGGITTRRARGEAEAENRRERDKKAARGITRRSDRGPSIHNTSRARARISRKNLSSVGPVGVVTRSPFRVPPRRRRRASPRRRRTFRAVSPPRRLSLAPWRRFVATPPYPRRRRRASSAAAPRPSP